MAGTALHATSSIQALGNGKTILQIVAPANQRVILQGWGLAIQGTTATDPPVFIELVRQTTAGTMSAGVVGANISKKNPNDAETIQTTVQVNATSEPAAGDILDQFFVHPQSAFRLFYPPDQHIEIPPGGRVGIRVTSAALTYGCVALADLVE